LNHALRNKSPKPSRDWCIALNRQSGALKASAATQGSWPTASGRPYPAIDNIESGDAGFTGRLIIADLTSLEEARA
tara:strand:- start:1920 stop:2147 length:228 start_codon:yes stop_codon:yes gene_type:complete